MFQSCSNKPAGYSSIQEHSSLQEKFGLLNDSIESNGKGKNSNNLLLFRYNPSSELPKLRLHRECSDKSPLNAIITKTSIVILGERQPDTNWKYVCIGHKSGWIDIPDSILVRRNHFERIHEVLEYETMQSDSWILCQGRYIFGSDKWVFFASNLLIIAPSILLFVEIAQELPYVLYLNGTLSLLLLIALVSLWLTYTTDPGILPANPPNIQPEYPFDVDKSLGEWKYCSTCNIYRPPRAKHCVRCQMCVQVFDHHCPWTGTCIGYYNYKYFLSFIVSLSLFTLLVCAICASVLATSQQHGFLEIIRENPVFFALGLFSFFSIWSLQSLCGYHMYLLIIGQTTNEHLKGVYRNNRNPHNKGCPSAIADTCCLENKSLLKLKESMNEQRYYDLYYFPQGSKDNSSSKGIAHTQHNTTICNVEDTLCNDIAYGLTSTVSSRSTTNSSSVSSNITDNLLSTTPSNTAATIPKTSHRRQPTLISSNDAMNSCETQNLENEELDDIEAGESVKRGEDIWSEFSGIAQKLPRSQV